jgi:hypothetical protein
MPKRAYLKIILPRHVIVLVSLGGAIGASRLSLERRSRINLIVWTGSLALFHLDKTRLREGKGEGFDGRHQSCRERGLALAAKGSLISASFGRCAQDNREDGAVGVAKQADE